MKKLFTFLTMLILCIGSMWAETNYFLTQKTEVTSITSGKYYVIDGRDQVGSKLHFLFDNGSKVTSNDPQSLPGNGVDLGKFVWKIEGNSTDGWTLQNLATGKYMSLGSSNGSQISSSSTPQTNGIYFAELTESETQVTYATILNSNGQAIDMGAYGSNPTTWQGSSTPGGSRRLKIYEVDVVKITDDACYTLDFVSYDETKTWGLKAGTTEQAPVANGTGDVFVAHSYINAAGNKRWIFVNNSNGTYLAYHGQANTAFDISNAINEWNIDILTSGTYVDASANLAGKLSITNDKRYTNNASQGCYLVKETNGAYDNASAPIYKLHNGNYFTAAIRFTATGDAVSSAATLAIAKFEALYEVKNYLPSAGNITALFADPSSIESNINAAATAEAAATIATNFMKSPEGKKFYAVASAATGQYMNIGPSAVSATSTTLTPEGVMELEYAGNGKYYLKGVRLEKYAGAPGNPPSTYSAKGDATAFYVGNYENATDNKVYFAKTKTNSTGEALHYNNTYTTYVTNWTYSAGASQWNITAVSDAEYTELCNNYCDVTFNAIMAASGEVKATATTIDVARGSTLAMPSAIARDYCTVTFYSDAACTSAITTVPDAATATVYALVTYTPPFTLSASYETATWYYATLRGSKYIRANENAKDDSGRYTTNTTNEKTDVYKWAFVGTSPYDLTIMNRGAGSGKYLYAESTTVPTMKAGVTPASDSKARWIATPNTTGKFALRNESGATLYINDAGGKGNLGFWNSTNGTSDPGSNWVITEVPTVDVTYEFVVGESTVNTIIVEDVPEYSEVAVPATLTNGYTTFAYDFENSGTIGGENSTVTVTGTLKDRLVKVGDLNNTKKYKITCARGSLSTYDDNGTVYLASPTKTSLGIEGKEFAIINHSGNNYLYSVSDAKFVTYSDNKHAPLTTKPATTDAITFGETTSAVYTIKFNNDNNKFLNSSNSYTYGIAINDWGSYTTDYDDGNQYIIEEIGDFDPTSATGTITYNNIINDLKNVRWGLDSEGNRRKLNYYNFIGEYDGYAGNELSIITSLESAGYSAENLLVVQGMNSLNTSYALNRPTAGKFYRIQGYGGVNSSGNYLANGGGVNNSKFTMSNDATDATTIFYYDGTKLTNLGSGMCNGMNKNKWSWVTGTNASVVTFQDGLTNGGYAIQSADDNAGTNGAYFYDASSTADRGGNMTITTSTDNRYTHWYLTEITSLPVAFDANALGYATFNSPVAVKLPTDVEAYVCQINGNTIKLYKADQIKDGDNWVLPANTPVLLYNTDMDNKTTKELTITSTEEAYTNNGFYGTIVAESPNTADYIYYALRRKTGEETVGFYKRATQSSTLRGFRAWITAENSGSAREFTILFDGDSDPTGIVEAMGLEDDNVEIYDINGRKLSSYQKGINIVNGKKVFK